MKKTIITTSIVTLAVAIILIVQAFYFYNLGSSTQADYNSKVQSEAVKLADQLKATQNK